MLQVPVATANLDSGEVTIEQSGDAEATKPLQLQHHPRCLTAGLHQSRVIADTTFQEQESMPASISVVVQDSNTLLGALNGADVDLRLQTRDAVCNVCCFS